MLPNGLSGPVFALHFSLCLRVTSLFLVHVVSMCTDCSAAPLAGRPTIAQGAAQVATGGRASPGLRINRTRRSSPEHAITPARHRDRNTPDACFARLPTARYPLRIDPASAYRRFDRDRHARPLRVFASLPSTALVASPRRLCWAILGHAASGANRTAPRSLSCREVHVARCDVAWSYDSARPAIRLAPRVSPQP